MIGSRGLNYLRRKERSIDWRLPLEAPFAPTPEEAISVALKLAGLREGELLYDLGCGDGRVLIKAVKEFGATAVGFEVQRKLVEEAKKRIRKAGVKGRAKAFKKDFFKEDLSAADVIYAYSYPPTMEALAEKLCRELKHGSRVVTYRYPIQNWIPHRVGACSGHSIFLYRLPESTHQTD